MRVEIAAEAQADAEEAIDSHIDHDAWTAAHAFHEELVKALARIAAAPGSEHRPTKACACCRSTGSRIRSSIAREATFFA